MSVCGGLNTASDATPEVQELVDSLSHEIKAQTGAEFPHLKAVSYRTQVVAGTNYFVKVNAGDEHLHVRIHKPLPHTGAPASLAAVQRSKNAEHPLEFF